MEQGLEELTGVHCCAAPKCFLMLGPLHGKFTGKNKTCFRRSCVAWAEQMLRVESLS